VTTIK